MTLVIPCGVMKTAVSIPEPIFARAEAYARRRNLSRSAVFATALDEFLTRQDSGEVTRRLNQVHGGGDPGLDPALGRMQAEALAPEDWD